MSHSGVFSNCYDEHEKNQENYLKEAARPGFPTPSPGFPTLPEISKCRHTKMNKMCESLLQSSGVILSLDSMDTQGLCSMLQRVAVDGSVL